MASGIGKKLGERIRTLRKARGWTQTDLAVHTGLGRQFISSVENGQNEPGLQSLVILAEVFGMTLSDLLKRL